MQRHSSIRYSHILILILTTILTLKNLNVYETETRATFADNIHNGPVL
jgi:hypothetical protein